MVVMLGGQERLLTGEELVDTPYNHAKITKKI